MKSFMRFKRCPGVSMSWYNKKGCSYQQKETQRRSIMSKEFEIGIGLLKKIYTELQALSTAEDKRQVKELTQAIINPLVAGAYQIKVGDGPQKDKLLEILFPLIRELRDMQNLESIRTLASELVNALNAIEAEVATQEGSS
jgi:hypothetical protein